METDETQENPPNESSATTQPIAPVGPDPRLIESYQQQLLAESRERARLQRELEEERNRRANVPEVVTPEQEREFFDRPRTATAEIVRAEIASQVAPLNQFVQQQQRQQIIFTLKGQMRQMPQQYPYVNQIEGLMDQVLQNAQVINGDVMAMAYNTALGYYVNGGGQLGTPQAPNTPQTPAPTTPVTPIPAHVRPSAPPAAPSNTRTPAKRTLNENEKRIARHNRMTDEEYIKWTDEVQPHEVAHVKDQTNG